MSFTLPESRGEDFFYSLAWYLFEYLLDLNYIVYLTSEESSSVRPQLSPKLTHWISSKTDFYRVLASRCSLSCCCFAARLSLLAFSVAVHEAQRSAIAFSTCLKLHSLRSIHLDAEKRRERHKHMHTYKHTHTQAHTLLLCVMLLLNSTLQSFNCAANEFIRFTDSFIHSRLRSARSAFSSSSSSCLCLLLLLLLVRLKYILQLNSVSISSSSQFFLLSLYRVYMYTHVYIQIYMFWCVLFIWVMYVCSGIRPWPASKWYSWIA